MQVCDKHPELTGAAGSFQQPGTVPAADSCSHWKLPENPFCSQFSPEQPILSTVFLSSLSLFPATAASTGESSTTENI